jgi:hypothetical protein
MMQGRLEHLIFDDQGKTWQKDSVELRRSLFFPENEPDFALQAVKDLGFIACERRGEGVIVTVCPRMMSPVAVASLLYWLSDDPPEQITLATFDDRLSNKTHGSFEKVAERLHRLLKGREYKHQPLFKARALSLDAVSGGSPFRWLLTNWERSNKHLSRRFSKEVDRRFEGRFCVFRPGNARSELVIDRVGTGLRIPDSAWPAFTPGTRLSDIPHSSYGKWVSEAYLSVLRSGRPNFSDVSAKIYWPQAGRLLYQSRRMIVAFLDADGHPLLLGASIAAVRLRASLESA